MCLYDKSFYRITLSRFFDFSYVNSSFDGIQEASMEVDVAKGRRDWAFSERDKVK